MSLSIIVAIAQNGAIGKDNDLLWHISDDLKRFKQLTLNHPVIMGRRTYLSLPRRPLPNRHNIVLSTDAAFCAEGASVAHSPQEALDLAGLDNSPFVIGGATVYERFLPMVDQLYVTWVYREFDADTFFPAIDMAQFEQIEMSPQMVDAASGLPYAFATYRRRHIG